MAAMSVSPFYIVNRRGTVHRRDRDEWDCPRAVDAEWRKSVSEVQIAVFRLPRCNMCFPSAVEYERISSGR